MKILHVITLSELGGAQSVIINLARKSVEDNHEVMVVSSLNGDLWDALPKNIKTKRITALQREVNLVMEWKVICELKIINQEFKPDVIHLHSSKIGILGRLAFPSKKIIYTVHGFDSIRLAFRKFLFLEKLLQNRARFIVAVSKYDYNNLFAEGIKKNVKYIYNGIADFRLEIKNDDEKYKINSSGFTVLSIARLAAPKRFDIFCKTAEILQNHAITFFWIGNKNQVTGLPVNVRCLGEIKDAHRLLAQANLFVLLSDYEGMPMSILEALSYSVPVIASNVGGIPEVLDGINGLTVTNEAQDVADAILSFKNNAEKYEKARKHARASYEANFTIDKMYSQYLSLYKSILNNIEI